MASASICIGTLRAKACHKHLASHRGHDSRSPKKHAGENAHAPPIPRAGPSEATSRLRAARCECAVHPRPRSQPPGREFTGVFRVSCDFGTMPAVGQSALEDGHFPRCRVFARPEKVRDVWLCTSSRSSLLLLLGKMKLCKLLSLAASFDALR